jgi:5-formyltetrahydrofolate cyclo-ligase
MSSELEELKSWRKRERARLVAARQAVEPATLEAWRVRMDDCLERRLPGLAAGVIGFCWPIKGEYDARHVVARLRSRGAVTALPVVVAPRTPLLFREWKPGDALAHGALDIPYPKDSREVIPDTVLLPMNGWDGEGYRLGYGGGFFDRTLASYSRRPFVIGVSYELARIETVKPQSWDIPVDCVLTERGLYRRAGDGRLAFEGA